ncbi:MAG TPA: TetR/AcrR family transcriptional regulator [Candidatus Dormibacteraeota bacterium]|nr:TetR/AcrR family transcriptional regulator [Candidatus Dormibacteraeota bacterium]
MTARSLSPSTPRGEATRQRVLEAAEQVFGEKGYHGASVTEITRAAGVAQGTFYLYFHGKKEIFLDLVDALGFRLRALTREASVTGRDYAEAQRLGFKAFFQFIRQHRHIYRIIQECDRVDSVTYRRFYTSLAEAYGRAIGEAESRGEVPADDPEVLAYCMLGVGHFVALRYLIWDDELGPAAEGAALRFVEAGIRNRG